MLFEQFLNDDLGCASYLVGDEHAGVAVVVDPPYYIEPVLAEAERQGVRLAGATFRRGLGNIAVTYTAGFASVPDDLAEAAIETVAYRYRERKRIGLTSQAIGGETTSYRLADFPPMALTIINTYKRVAPRLG